MGLVGCKLPCQCQGQLLESNIDRKRQDPQVEAAEALRKLMLARLLDGSDVGRHKVLGTASPACLPLAAPIAVPIED